MQHLLGPLVVSWGWQPEKTTLLSLDSAEASPFVLQQEWQGTRDIAARFASPSRPLSNSMGMAQSTAGRACGRSVMNLCALPGR
jgi:hypothetical protein